MMGKLNAGVKFRLIMAGLLWVILLVYGIFPAQASELTEKGYSLEQMVVMSRHGVRTPLGGKDSMVSRMTPHSLHVWNIAPGHLTLKGAINETAFGEYFRCYLVDEGFMPENWVPEPGEVSFYTNSFQRTIATAKYFSAGMFPVADIPIEHKLALDKSDPVFIQPIVFDTPRLYELGMDYHEKYLRNNMVQVGEWLASFEKVMDFKNSSYAREKGIDHIPPTDIRFRLRGEDLNKPGFEGMVYDAYKAVDPLIMQYYEEPDDNLADWGEGLTRQDWENIGAMNSTGLAMICGNPAIATRNTHALLKLIDDDLKDENKRFSFICGHDTNIIMLMTVLDTGDYRVPGVISYKAPIGGKIVLEKRRGKDGNLYVNAFMIYQSDAQIRNCSMLDLANPPLIYQLNVQSLPQNEDGLYLYDDFEQFLQDSFARYEYYTAQ